MERSNRTPVENHHNQPKSINNALTMRAPSTAQDAQNTAHNGFEHALNSYIHERNSSLFSTQNMYATSKNTAFAEEGDYILSSASILKHYTQQAQNVQHTTINHHDREASLSQHSLANHQGSFDHDETSTTNITIISQEPRLTFTMVISDVSNALTMLTKKIAGTNTAFENVLKDLKIQKARNLTYVDDIIHLGAEQIEDIYAEISADLQTIVQNIIPIGNILVHKAAPDPIHVAIINCAIEELQQNINRLKNNIIQLDQIVSSRNLVDTSGSVVKSLNDLDIQISEINGNIFTSLQELFGTTSIKLPQSKSEGDSKEDTQITTSIVQNINGDISAILQVPIEKSADNFREKLRNNIACTPNDNNIDTYEEKTLHSIANLILDSQFNNNDVTLTDSI